MFFQYKDNVIDNLYSLFILKVIVGFNKYSKLKDAGVSKAKQIIYRTFMNKTFVVVTKS